MEPLLSKLEELKGDRVMADGASAPTLHSLSDPEALYRFALDVALDLVEAHTGSLFLWDEFQKVFALKASRGKNRHRLQNTQVGLGEGILGWVGERSSPLLVRDIRQDERFQSVRREGHYRSHSFMVLPLIVSNKLMGVINITERSTLLPFDQEDLIRLQQWSSHVAVAYDNLRRLHRLRSDNETLHQTVTELKQKIAAGEPLTSIGKLATQLAHELNNPLDAIRRYVNLALDQAVEDSLTREYLLKAKKGIRRAINVIRGLLHFSREMHQTPGQIVDIHVLLEQSLESLLEDPAFKQINIEKHFSPHPAFVLDRGLPIVFRNLYRNAQQAMQGSGILTVSTQQANGTVAVSVRDTGVGIPEVMAKQLFEPFFTTKNQGDGTGVGLTLCREIVERCWGKIGLGRIPDQGACFVVTLPCQPSQQEPHEKHPVDR